MIPVNAIPEMLAERREEEGISQRAAARELGVSPQTYVWWERGAVTPKAMQAAALAACLGISKTDVLVALGVLEPGETIVVTGVAGEAADQLAGGQVADR